jgi:hypothetical protein
MLALCDPVTLRRAVAAWSEGRMGYSAMEILVSPDVPDDVTAAVHHRRRSRRLNPWAAFSLGLAGAAAVPYQVGGAIFGLHGTWRIVDITLFTAEAAAIAVAGWRARSRGRRFDRRWGHRVINTAEQATDNPDTAARLAALDRLIVRFRGAYLALVKTGYEPAGITARTADDLHYALAAPIINSFALRDLLAGPDAYRPRLAEEIEVARAELAAMNTAFDNGYVELTQLCEQLDEIGARLRLRAALTSANSPAVAALDVPDIEALSAVATATVELLRSSLVHQATV